MSLLLSLQAACISVSAAPLAPASARPALTVTLRAHAELDSAAIRLGDIADVAGADTRAVERLRALPLGSLFTGGATIDRKVLENWLRRTGIDSRHVAWVGASEIKLQRLVQPVALNTVRAVAQELLVKTLAPLKGRLVIEPEPQEASVDLPSGHLQFQARAMPSGTMPARHMLVWVDVSANGHFVRAVPVRFAVSLYVPAWTVKSPATAATRISADEVERCEIDLAALEARGDTLRSQDDTFTAPAQVLLLRQDLRPGQPLTWKNAAEPPLVARGTPAKLRMHGAAIDVESSVQVLQDGFLGQTVKVRAPGSTGAILATVAGPGILEAKL